MPVDAAMRRMVEVVEEVAMVSESLPSELKVYHDSAGLPTAGVSPGGRRCSETSKLREAVVTTAAAIHGGNVAMAFPPRSVRPAALVAAAGRTHLAVALDFRLDAIVQLLVGGGLGFGDGDVSLRRGF
jgi:hypothetical protein